jgi:hypothetical protein
MRLRRLQLLLLVIAALANGALFVYLPTEFFFDASKMARPTLMENANTLGYWWHIFTHSNHGPQYRPLGFFGYFYLVDWVFGASALAHTFISALFFNGCLYLMAQLLRARDSLAGCAAWIFFALNPAFLSIKDFSFNLKYYGVMLFFVWGLKKISLAGWTKTLTLQLTLGLFLALLSHEGSLTLGAVFLVCHFALHRRIPRHALWTLLPLFTYLAVRLANGVPRQGFMQVGMDKLLPLAGSYLGISWAGHGVSQFPLFSTPLILTGLAGLLLFSALALRGKSLPLAGLTLAVVMVASPFSLLPQHSAPDRVMWALPLVAMLWQLVFREVGLKWQRPLLVGWLLLTHVGLTQNLLHKQQSLTQQVRWMEEVNTELLKHATTQPPVPVVRFSDNSKLDRWHGIFLLGAQFAWRYPDRMLYLEWDDFPSKQLIIGGSSYHYPAEGGSTRWIRDVFSAWHQRELPPQGTKITLPIIGW